MFANYFIREQFEWRKFQVLSNPLKLIRIEWNKIMNWNKYETWFMPNLMPPINCKKQQFGRTSIKLKHSGFHHRKKGLKFYPNWQKKKVKNAFSTPKLLFRGPVNNFVVFETYLDEPIEVENYLGIHLKNFIPISKYKIVIK